MNRYQRIALEEASDDQLRDFCHIQGLEPGASDQRPTLLAQLQPVWEHDYIMVLGEPASPAAQQADPAQVASTAPVAQTAPVSMVAQHRLSGGTGANDPKVLLKIGATPYPGGSDPVALGHNGTTIVVQRNMLVEMPYRYYIGPLKDAIRGEVSQPDDGSGNPSREFVETEYTNYPISQLTLPSAEEIAAWHAKVDNDLMPA